MNTTREQRAEAYTDKPDGVSTSEGHFYYLSEVEAAHIAGATEEAAIKDAVIKQRDDVILELAADLRSSQRTLFSLGENSKGIEFSGSLSAHSALLKELAKGKV